MQAKGLEASVGDQHGTHLDKIWKALFTSRAGEIAIIDVDGHVIFEQIQAVKRFWTENAGVGFLVQVELHMTLQGPTVDEALVTDVTGQRAIPFPPMEPQVLIQLVLFPEGLPTLQTFKRTEGLSDEQVLKSCILKENPNKACQR